MGFSPGAVLLTSVQNVAAGAPVDHNRLGLGAADSAFHQGSSALADEDGLATTTTWGTDTTTSAFVKSNNGTGSIDARGGGGQFRRRRLHPRLDDQRHGSHADRVPGPRRPPDRGGADVVLGRGCGWRGRSLLGKRLRAGQSRLPPVPIDVRSGPYERITSSLIAGLGLVPCRGVVLVRGRGSRVGAAVLLPSGGHRHVVGVDAPRAGVGAGGSRRAASSERR